MSATLPRSQKSKKPPTLSHSSKESKRCKKEFHGTGASKSKSNRQEVVPQHTSHPWAGLLDNLLKPFPPDVRFNIQRAIGGFCEAVGSMFPAQGESIRVGRRGF